MNISGLKTGFVSAVGLVVLIAPGAGAEPVESAQARESAEQHFPTVSCIAEQTGGFHDYPGEGEVYEPALFHPIAFTLEENLIFMTNLGAGEGGPDLYLTLHTTNAAETRETELECRQVRGSFGATGFSCVNKPPSEMLLINRDSLRFTRTAVGGWTFVGAADGPSDNSSDSRPDSQGGDSIFVEYGTCHRQPP